MNAADLQVITAMTAAEEKDKPRDDDHHDNENVNEVVYDLQDRGTTPSQTNRKVSILVSV